MTIRGIDVSSWNGYPYNQATAAVYPGADFVIVKATQSTNYLNPSYAGQYGQAKKDGKLLGTYHYAGGGDPISEAAHYYNKVRSTIGEAIPCLDWEEKQNKAWGNVSWARRFVDEFHRLSGVWPMIYVQASAINQVASCAKDCSLWVAGYPDYRENWNVPAFRYSLSPWGTYTIWQYTSGGGVDRNTAKLNAETWRKIANPSGAKKTNTATTESIKNKDLTVVAKEVISGIWGNGKERKNKLTTAGYDYNAVQNKVNELMDASKKTTAYYTVKSGDNMSVIAQKHGLTLAQLAKLNTHIKNLNLIYPGQKIRVK